MISAALEVLADAGPDGFSIARVAKRAGVHETSIYRRWGTRERLAVEAMTELSEELLPIPDTGSLHDDLVAFGEALVAYSTTPLGKALLHTLASTADDELAAEARTKFWLSRFGEASTLVKRAVDRGEIREDVDVRGLLETFVAPIHFRLLLTREPVGLAILQELAARAIRAC